ncbi:hypothetical protein [Mycolicibacterium mengxianglii]|uniref:hypothetical protein n=1 Tax=Mycolicibacterium mengxianglii TaxID=2736649 RepID=UPI0018D017D5|nr:hypothetical protein [Mycolicibacterium mengxianglii]
MTVKNFTTTITRGALATAFGGSLLITAGLGLAHAEPAPPSPPPPAPDGLVSVVIGGAPFLDSVPPADAIDAIVDKCSVAEQAANAMVVQVDATGVSQTVCTEQPDGDVVLTQNGTTSPVIPGTSAEVAENPSAEPAAPPPVEAPGSGGGDAPQVGGDEVPEPNNISGMN